MLLAGVTACLVAFAATPVVLAGLRAHAVLDPVTERSSHAVPTVRGGGLAVVIAVLAATAALAVTGRGGPQAGAVVAVAAFGAVGLAEDLVGVPVLPRFGLQMLAAGLAVGLALSNVGWLPGLPAALGVLVVVAAMLWVVAFVNIFNFMDGVNGISAAQALIAGTAYLTVGVLDHSASLRVGGLLAAASAVGFAPWNFPRARIFLGDVGSHAFGGLLGVLALGAALDTRAAEAAIAPLVLYLADTSVTLVRRTIAGEQWYRPHRTHTYQRLTVAGWSHERVTCTFGALALITSGLGLVAEHSSPIPRAFADLAIVLVTLGYLTLPALVARRRPLPLDARPAQARVDARPTQGPVALPGPPPQREPSQADEISDPASR
ncbi:MAG: glycosyl transferase [Frankia sp.]